MSVLEQSNHGIALRQEGRRSVGAPSILVAIASHGTAQDHYLAQMLAEFRKFSLSVTPVVMTNKFKTVEGAEVVVGVPSPDPYSLPFAHRKLFAERADDYDLFIYTEDDMLITEEHINLFLELQPKLQEKELLGFLRSEVDPAGEKYVSSIHTHFRWLPDTVVTRGGEVFAELSNQHAGCFMITREQLHKAIGSGGFLIPPHAGKYGMLESAATDIYLRCGFKRVLCVSRIEDSVIPHLPNKYYKRLGIPIEQLRKAREAMLGLVANGGWTGSLFEPQTSEFGFRWSKELYAGPDSELLSRVKPGAKRALVVGSTSGKNEQSLRDNGLVVTSLPLDGVFGHLLRSKRFTVVEGSFPEGISKIKQERFDVVVLPDLLHLIPDPIGWLKQVRSLLTETGQVLFSVPNSADLVTRINDRRAGRADLGSDFQSSQVHKVSSRTPAQWLRAAGFGAMRVEACLDPCEKPTARSCGFAVMKKVFADRFVASGEVR
jgi:hypothetical protein